MLGLLIHLLCEPFYSKPFPVAAGGGFFFLSECQVLSGFRARCRVKKLPRIIVLQILLLASSSSQEGPGGALCGVLPCGNIVCRLCAGTRHRGRKSGRCGACVPPGCFACAMQPPHHENQPTRRAAYSRGSGTFPPAGHCARVWPRALPCHETRGGEGAGHAAAGAGTSRCGGSRC